MTLQKSYNQLTNATNLLIFLYRYRKRQKCAFRNGSKLANAAAKLAHVCSTYTSINQKHPQKSINREVLFSHYQLSEIIFFKLQLNKLRKETQLCLGKSRNGIELGIK
jgi:hypothetical protein